METNSKLNKNNFKLILVVILVLLLVVVVLKNYNSSKNENRIENSVNDTQKVIFESYNTQNGGFLVSISKAYSKDGLNYIDFDYIIATDKNCAVPNSDTGGFTETNLPCYKFSENNYYDYYINENIHTYTLPLSEDGIIYARTSDDPAKYLLEANKVFSFENLKDDIMKFTSLSNDPDIKGPFYTALIHDDKILTLNRYDKSLVVTPTTFKNDDGDHRVMVKNFYNKDGIRYMDVDYLSKTDQLSPSGANEYINDSLKIRTLPLSKDAAYVRDGQYFNSFNEIINSINYLKNELQSPILTITIHNGKVLLIKESSAG